jgi:DNA primase
MSEGDTFVIPREKEAVIERPKIILDDMLTRLDQLPAHHRAVEYVKARQIPKERWDDLYYARDFKVLEALNPAYEGRLASDERLVIPFRREDGLLTGVTGRAMGNSSLRYATIRITDDPLVYGLERIKRGKTIYVTEGPIDSMFLDNAIAAGGTDFSRALYNISGKNVVLIFDNQPRNKQVVKRVEAFAQRGHAMVIWNSNWTYKDINDAVLSGSSISEIEYLLNKSTFKGLALKLAIRDWKKC